MPGWLIPSLYFQYLRGGGINALLPVFEHNRLDVLSLLALAGHLGSLLHAPDAANLESAECYGLARLYEERMSAAYFPSAREYSRRYGLDARRVGLLPPHAVVMHPGPMNRGLEISADAADSARSTIVEQVANGVSVRMAVLYLLLSAAREDGPAEVPATEQLPEPTLQGAPA